MVYVLDLTKDGAKQEFDTFRDRYTDQIRLDYQHQLPAIENQPNIVPNNTDEIFHEENHTDQTLSNISTQNNLGGN